MKNMRINFRAALTSLALLAVGSGALAQGTPPAQIDMTTPHVQNGLTLLAVTRGDAQGQYTFPLPANMDFLSGPRGNGPPGGIGLWIRGVKPSASRPRPGMAFRGPYFQNPTANAIALNGDNLPAQVEPVSSFSYNPQGQQSAPLYLVTLPGGYPDGYPAIDVSLNGLQGHSARWRLIRLTAPYHAIVPPVNLHSVFTGGGATLTVRAWRDTGGRSFGGNSSYFMGMGGVHYALTAKVPAGSSWVVRIFKRQLEWEAVRPGEIAALTAHYPPQYQRQMLHRPLWVDAIGPDIHYPMQDMVQTPYGKYSHYLRLSGEMVQMASATENVTFHNLNIRQIASPNGVGRVPRGYTPPPSYQISAAPQTITTPSGISITLLPLSALGQQNHFFGGYGMPNTILMLLRFGQMPPGQSPYQPSLLTLPRSPLYKKYHKPVSYSLQGQKPYFLEPFYGGFFPQRPGAPVQMVEALRMPFSPPVRVMQNGRMTYRMSPTAIPKHLDTLTLRVVQSAELRSLPISFLVPIGNQPPAVPPISRPMLRKN